MARCSVADVRAKVFTSQTTDLQITAIIADVTDEVSTLAGTLDQTNLNLNQAVKWAARAATLQYMITTGEMAANIKFGNSQQQNATDPLVQAYETKAEFYIQKYKMSSFSIPSGRMGYGTVNNTEGFHELP